ncbi:uncharacterized protein CELE_Y73B6BL.270 [Caenorhabditis elegans]|uniref:Uncharacterized protein n=1 Tax=Caenorhabditis elegans TaxID=6239 RepID=D0G917_CAEEL|nr:Uncharacterized protein CELE_Y73B6BL.270 [Caenorhabditis elegans]CCD74197.1 Uncharacterized protein CELE_Y73B6BL.270 [Caenorhabditis elegans]|eukprot:NP_001255284.1 Uncharacterized protein CELE_Y73B6BL.270 [Caenorhabditis elegans]
MPKLQNLHAFDDPSINKQRCSPFSFEKSHHIRHSFSLLIHTSD